MNASLRKNRKNCKDSRRWKKKDAESVHAGSSLNGNSYKKSDKNSRDYTAKIMSIIQIHQTEQEGEKTNDWIDNDKRFYKRIFEKIR